MSNEMFLEDFIPVFQYQLTEAEEGRPKGFYIKGIVSRCDVLNKNKRIYPRAVMAEAVNKIQESVLSGGFVGELGHPNSPPINIDKISHKITKLELAPDGAVLAEMVVLDTTQGKELKKLIEGGVRLGVSTRALGGVKQSSSGLGEGVLEVLPGLNIKAIDVVFDPSAGEDGRPDFVSESTIYESSDGTSDARTFSSVWNEEFGGKIWH